MFDAGLNPLKDRSRAVLQHFGLGPYAEILALQERLRDSRAADAIPDTWLAGEHPVVVTQGVRASDADLLSAPGPLSGAPVVRIDRGGMTTLHSPGQLVLYPIVKLVAGSLGAGQFSRALVHQMQEWLDSEFGVAAEPREGHPGLFVGGRKLLSVGISVRGGVSMHGVSLNVSNDLALWRGIVPCGAPEIEPVSLALILGRALSVGALLDPLAAWLGSHWGYESVARASGPDQSS